MDGEKRRTVPLSLVSVFLRVGLAIVFLYAALGSFITPDAWIGYFPGFLRKVFPESILLFGFSAAETGLSLWLLSGKRLFYAASLSALMLAGIVLVNLGAMDIVFRDIGLFFSASGLAALSYSERGD